ncbi:hypothetical protein Taro_005047 [Colocasia esculenta]|uniref:Uncharacterized protein n=1 Tax=Colocasia esculenta TaxID=4460 RepID=A0A843TTH4_COLES|nr:hypothetical protein [Colocasia esculenta]
MRRDISNFDPQAMDEGKAHLSLEEPRMGRNRLDAKFAACGRRTSEMTRGGHVSDPGIRQPSLFWGSPSLKRSCSNLESRAASCQLLASSSMSFSYVDLQNLLGNMKGGVSQEFHHSPLSIVTPRSADRLISRKRSSSQVLPSRSRKLWWKLFLQSHGNLHRPSTSTGQINPGTFNDDANTKGGCSSDTLETSHDMAWRRTKGKEVVVDCSTGDLWSQNPWLAFSAESSSLHWVCAWIDSLEENTWFLVDDGGEDYEEQEEKPIVFPNSPENGESSGVNKQIENSWRLAEEVLLANNVIQSLNPLSSVAHISNLGLKVIPAMSAFSSLRDLNLSSNFIVHITSGMLPKSLHMLDLSKNKIAAIEGLRELTHLRVLNLSYNRISRIGHGLSDCSLIKELNLAGNKISYIEGLHRLLKLSVLDLSFNKISTVNALGQIVANYSSLLALNLLGNPIQSNFGDDQLRKAVTSLLPQLAYLNKQPTTKAGRVRAVTTDNIAKAALGSSERGGSRRRSAKLSGQNSGSSVRCRIGGATGRRGQLGGLGEHSSSKKQPKNKYQSSVRK